MHPQPCPLPPSSPAPSGLPDELLRLRADPLVGAIWSLVAADRPGPVAGDEPAAGKKARRASPRPSGPWPRCPTRPAPGRHRHRSDRRAGTGLQGRGGDAAALEGGRRPRGQCLLRRLHARDRCRRRPATDHVLLQRRPRCGGRLAAPRRAGAPAGAVNPDGSLPPPPFELVDNEHTILPAATSCSSIRSPPATAGRPRTRSRSSFSARSPTSRRWPSSSGSTRRATPGGGVPSISAAKATACSGLRAWRPSCRTSTACFSMAWCSSRVSLISARSRAGRSNDLPYSLFLPSYTAVAHAHGRLPADLQADRARAAGRGRGVRGGRVCDGPLCGQRSMPERHAAGDRGTARPATPACRRSSSSTTICGSMPRPSARSCWPTSG